MYACHLYLDEYVLHVITMSANPGAAVLGTKERKSQLDSENMIIHPETLILRGKELMRRQCARITIWILWYSHRSLD